MRPSTRSREALERLLAILSPVAVRLLQLRDLQRLQAEQPVAGLLPPQEIWLAAHLAQIPEEHLTVGTFW